MILPQDFASCVHSQLIITERPSIYEVASGVNASDCEQMHLCSFNMFETWPSSMYSSSEKRSGMDIGKSSRSGVDAKRSHTKPESPVRQTRTALDSNEGVPVNLTCKLTRKPQTVKFKSVSTGFPNHSHTTYRQGSADTKNDSRSRIKSV